MKTVVRHSEHDKHVSKLKIDADQWLSLLNFGIPTNDVRLVNGIAARLGMTDAQLPILFSQA